jgi:hypothetical protein
VNGNAADIVADRFTLAGMEPGADFDAKRPDLVGNGAGAAHATRRTVEGGKNAIAGRLDLMTAKACKVPADRGACMISRAE